MQAPIVSACCRCYNPRDTHDLPARLLLTRRRQRKTSVRKELKRITRPCWAPPSQHRVRVRAGLGTQALGPAWWPSS